MRSGLRPQVGRSTHLYNFLPGTVFEMDSATTKTTQIVVNGQVRDVPEGRSLSETLVFLGVDPSRVAVELNRVIVSRQDWDRVRIDGGAALEIVQFVGGG